MFDLLLIAIGVYVIVSKITKNKNPKTKQNKKEKFFDFKDRDPKKYFDEYSKPKQKSNNSKNVQKNVPAKKNVQKKPAEEYGTSIVKTKKQKETIEENSLSSEIKKAVSPREMFLYHELLSKPKSLRK